jgi:hypothetical protein
MNLNIPYWEGLGGRRKYKLRQTVLLKETITTGSVDDGKVL